MIDLPEVEFDLFGFLGYLYSKFENFFIGAGWKEWLILGGVSLFFFLVYLVITWLVYKWQSDGIWKLAIWLGATMLFFIAFCFFFWLHINNYSPFLNFIGLST